MKQISFFLAAALLILPAISRAQDAATEERLNKLSAQILDLAEAREAQSKRIDELAKAVAAIQQQLDKPNVNYASQDDVKKLADKLQEVDRKRQEDNDRILKGVEQEFKDLAKTMKKQTVVAPTTSNDNATSDKVFEYVVQPGDTLSAIIAAYREKNIKISLDQILKANPGLKPESMPVGKKIIIPAP
ncbi:MAG TPA: LysM domain-containing protein [Verrucomicrobiae bacterium]|nr:LysM domain-containing protein [Verrucomicrobiae bacterium]